jgi:hypothetical protein
MIMDEESGCENSVDWVCVLASWLLHIDLGCYLVCVCVCVMIFEMDFDWVLFLLANILWFGRVVV